MENKSILRARLVMLVLVLAIAPAVALDMQMGDSNKNGGQGCESECEGEKEDTESDGPDGGNQCGIPTGQGPIFPGELPPLEDLGPMMQDCMQGPGIEYEYTDLYDAFHNGTIVGYSVLHKTDGDRNMEGCIGENNATIQWVSLRADRAGLVARILKFQNAPARDGRLWIGIDDNPEIELATVGILTADDLNQTIVSRLEGEGYVVDTDSEPNFIRVSHSTGGIIWPPPDLHMNQVSLRTTDSGLTAFRIALRDNAEPGDYDCNTIVPEPDPQ